MVTVIAWIGAQAVGAFPMWGALYVWALFCDMVVLGAMARVVSASRHALARRRGLEAANDGRAA